MRRTVSLFIIIFIPGYSASNLSKDGQRIWLTRSQAFGLVSRDLSLPYRWKDGVQARDAVKPDGALQSLSLPPYKVDICGTWLQSVSTSDEPVYSFSYDWRREGAESLSALERFVDGVRAEYPGEKIKLVGHSFGGLLSIAFTNKHPEAVSKLILVGTPQKGSVIGLRDFQEGLPVLFNKEILSPQTLCSFACPYSSLPEEKWGAADEDGKYLELDYWSAETWRENRFGLFGHPEALQKIGENTYFEFLKTALEQGKKFRLASSLQPGIAYPPITIVLSEGIPTVWRMQKIKEGWKFIDSADGDGRLTVAGGLPDVQGLHYELIFTRRAHSYMLTDPALIRRLLEILY